MLAVWLLKVIFNINIFNINYIIYVNGVAKMTDSKFEFIQKKIKKRKREY